MTKRTTIAALRELPQNAVLTQADWCYKVGRARYEGSLSTNDDEDEDGPDD
jgi:hypothetical protein